MSISYDSARHHDDDPGGLIAEALAMGAEFPGPAEDLLLAWALRLPADVDASAAAWRLLQRHGIAKGSFPDDARGRLISLLRETATMNPPPVAGRRGGARRRRE